MKWKNQNWNGRKQQQPHLDVLNLLQLIAEILFTTQFQSQKILEYGRWSCSASVPRRRERLLPTTTLHFFFFLFDSPIPTSSRGSCTSLLNYLDYLLSLFSSSSSLNLSVWFVRLIVRVFIYLFFCLIEIGLYMNGYGNLIELVDFRIVDKCFLVLHYISVFRLGCLHGWLFEDFDKCNYW